MSNNLRPIGSEKLQGLEKINRIIEISRYKENLPSNINETSRNEYDITLSDGQNYAIVREKSGYIIKKTISEGVTEYIEPMKNRKYFQSYSQAFKKLNLMAKELNTLHENAEGISLFSEQKKFVLKTPKSEVPAEPTPDDSEELDLPPVDDIDLPEPSGEDMASDDMGSDEIDIDIPTGEDMGGEDMGGEEASEGGNTLKSIQKLTGKLAQRIRTINNGEGLNSNDAKYVLNSIISAINLEKMDDDDKDEIISRLEGAEIDDYNLEPEVDFEADLDIEEPSFEEEDEFSKEEVGEAEQPGMLGKKFTDGVKSKFTSIAKEKMGEMSEDMEKKHIENIFDEVFSESKIDKVITKYFHLSENEKKVTGSKINKKISEINSFAKSNKQKLVAEDYLKNNPNAILLGKSNKNNIIFVNEGKKIKITPNGQLI